MQSKYNHSHHCPRALSQSPPRCQCIIPLKTAKLQRREPRKRVRDLLNEIYKNQFVETSTAQTRDQKPETGDQRPDHTTPILVLFQTRRWYSSGECLQTWLSDYNKRLHNRLDKRPAARQLTIQYEREVLKKKITSTLAIY